MATDSKQESARQNGSTFRSLQHAVSEYLIRHRSILDVISKFQETSARVNRAVVKAITSCGCIEVRACRQQIPADISYWEMKHHMETHVQGELCEHCREVLEQELGHTLFYAAALCDLFGLDLEQLADDERKRIATLGVYNLT